MDTDPSSEQHMLHLQPRAPPIGVSLEAMRSNEIIDKTFPGTMVLILQITLSPGHVYHNM
ncbi:hypothetical protein GN244_ATG19370 [Phytophthora infestans]|uniref:Uncharacterized protein n=1 Tax=Phytophthora infestans TaxID=4787 RepID=A0A833S4S0_PHYIN|nr:hypothetical protein GN244_ATG19370 [Phytophthora infestans]